MVSHASVFADTASLAPSLRTEINLGAQPWTYLPEDNGNNQVDGDNNNLTNPPAAAVNFDDSKWQKVGMPYSTTQWTTFINLISGDGDGQLGGTIGWYRTKLTNIAQYKNQNKKITIEFEGVHMGAQVYVNGTFIKTTSAVPEDQTATHVNGFLPFIVDVTPYLHFDGTDTIAVKGARNGDFFIDPTISGASRFGQADTGIFRPVRMHVTDQVYIPENVYSGSQAWGTYVSTVSASDSSAIVRVQTNVANERDVPVTATLTTQIVDTDGTVVATQQDQKVLPAHTSTFVDPTPVFDQQLTVNNPKLWYPNNSPWGTPHLYNVLHTVSVNGQVIDAKQSTVGIRVITWDKDFPYINGHKHYLWGAAGRYDYPGLATSVPEEQQWRDLAQLAAAGGSLWRPGHSSSSPEFVAAADAYGIFIVQPSGDGENGFSLPCALNPNDPNPQLALTQCQDKEIIKKELHRDMIIRDRSHPSILAWEANNGTMYESYAADLRKIVQQWDPINPRAQTDRTPDVNNGDVISCDGAGCEVNLKQTNSASKPVYGAEYWSRWGNVRTAYDTDLAFALQYLTPWMQGRQANTFGMTQWYFADTPGENFEYLDGTDHTLGRNMAQSMVDHNRFPRLLYYIYQANWANYPQTKSIKLAGTWNRPAGQTRVNAFSNCPKVQLLINGNPVGGQLTPNSWDSDTTADNALATSAQDGKDVNGDTLQVPIPADVQQAEQTTKLPGQVHLDTTFQPGTVTAQCLDDTGAVQASDTLATSSKADHLVLKMVKDVVRPDGTSFQVTANGSDVAFVEADVVDAQGNLVMTGDGSNALVTFSVSGPVEYHGGSQSLVTPNAPARAPLNNSLSYHAPGDPELQFEGGLTKIALRSQFQTGSVTVTATSPGLGSAQVSYDIAAVPNPVVALGKPSIIAQPIEQDVTANQPAQFTVTATGAGPLTFHWFKNKQPIGGNTAVLVTNDTAAANDGDVYSVDVSNDQGDQLSADAVLHVFAPAPIVITQAPVAVNVDAGQTAHFAVVASGSPTVSYQWFKNDQPIPGAQSPTFDTGVLATTDGGNYKVTVQNPVNSITTTPVALTVNAARPPTVIQDPTNVVTNPGQPATFSVVAGGSSPFHYSWTKGGSVVGDDSATLTIAKVTPSDAGDYQVAVTNITGQTVVSKVATLKLAPPGANLALNKVTFDSSEENPGVGGTRGQYAVDGLDGQNGTPETRWGSAFNGLPTSDPDPDKQWLDIDLGSTRNFNRVVLEWEAAYGSAYKLQYSNDRKTWNDAFCEGTEAGASCDSNGTGGTEDKSFSSVQGRYIRMQGVKRGTQFGFSLLEMQVYNAATCSEAGKSNERFTVNDTTTVTDNLSQLIWTRTPHTLPGSAQLEQADAANYCAGIGARLPTVAEAKAVSGANAVTCAFPTAWNTWTSEADPAVNDHGFVVSSAGDVTSQVADNFPGQAMCVSGAQVLAPVITTGPLSQNVGAGRSIHLTVNATGVGPLSYEWFRDGKSVFVTSDPFYDTPAAGAAGSSDTYLVQVTSAQGLTVASATATLTADSSTLGNIPPDGGNNTNTGGNTGNNGGNNGNGGTNNTDNSPGDGHNGVNLALGKTASAKGSESGQNGIDAGYLESANAFDGDFTNTRWSSEFEDDTWIQVDLGAVHTFDHAVLRWERAYSTNYMLETSVDGVNWDDSKAFYAEGPDQAFGGTERVSFAPQTARYVRLHSTARSSQYGVSLYEFEVYAAPAPTFTVQPAPQTVVAGQAVQFSVQLSTTAPVTYQWRRNGTPIDNTNAPTYGFTAAQGDTGASFDVVVTDSNGNTVDSQPAVLTVTAASSGNGNTGTGNTGTGNSGTGNGGTGQTGNANGNLALNMPVKSSGVENPIAFKAENVNDGDTGTRWSSSFDDNQWVEVDLGAVKPLNHVVLNWENAFATSYEIQVSNDENQWTSVVCNTNGQGGVEDLAFAPVSARYVRMFGKTRNTQYGFSLWELQIFNDASTASAPTCSNAGTPPGTGSGTPPPGTGNGNTGTTDPNTPPDYTVFPGFVGTEIVNNTNGKYTDDQVYVTIIGRDPNVPQGQSEPFSSLAPDGTLTHLSMDDINAPNHLVKNGQNYANYSFTLAQSKLVKIPKMDSGRIYISYGQPMYMNPVLGADGLIGFAGPNPQNGTDPNLDVHYDWYEFTLNDTLFINNTQVDSFGFPTLLDVWGDNKNFHQQTGISPGETHDGLIAGYNAAVPAEFQQADPTEIRILAPAKSTFDAGQPHGTYFDAYVNQIWQKYTDTPLTVLLNEGTRKFQGTVQASVTVPNGVDPNTGLPSNTVENNVLVFNEIDSSTGDVLSGPYIVNKPNTQEILECSGAMAIGNDTEKALEAQICAAFNRHIMDDSTLWTTPSAWYLAAPANFYAKYWHVHSVNARAYGFAFDDVDDQSSSITAPKAEHVILTVGW